MLHFKCSLHDLVLVYINSDRNVQSIERFVRENGNLNDENVSYIINHIQKGLIPHINDRWLKSGRQKEKFFKNNANWLNKEYCVNVPIAMKSINLLRKRGRPLLPYEKSADSTKRRKNVLLLEDNGLQHIQSAYSQKLRAIGEIEEAKLVELIRYMEKSKKQELLKTLEKHEEVKPLDSTEALSVFLDLDLTKSQYTHLRIIMLNNNCPLMPPYYKIQREKLNCYPNSLEIGNTVAKVKSLQELLDHTAKRILMIDNVENKNMRKLTLYCKWGCDGSSGQSEYKQFLPEESENISDGNLFITSLVPIKIIDREGGSLVWQNPVPSSVRYCRPISIEMCKETPEKTKEVVQNIESQIKSLLPTFINCGTHELEISHELLLTMVDGKVVKTLTNTTSCAVCTICNASPKQMNDIPSTIKRTENENALQYGMSTLHAWIRCMEMILHLSYNLDFQKWSAISKEHQVLKKCKKKLVQKRFREELGLIIDKPRQGSGNSNDGNTARRFFSNAEVSAEITGIDVQLIRMLYNILQALSCGVMIDGENYNKYALQIANLYVEKYKWYYMPSSVHKLLIHGKSILNHFSMLPMGHLSEDAQESRNKDYKNYRLNHSRKNSRIATNEDVFKRLLCTSDPYISSIRKETRKACRDLDEDAVLLLKMPHTDNFNL